MKTFYNTGYIKETKYFPLLNIIPKWVFLWLQNLTDSEYAENEENANFIDNK